MAEGAVVSPWVCLGGTSFSLRAHANGETVVRNASKGQGTNARTVPDHTFEN